MGKKNKAYYIDRKGSRETNSSAVLSIVGFETETETVLLYNLGDHTLSLASLNELTAVVMDDTLENIFNAMKTQSKCDQSFVEKMKGLVALTEMGEEDGQNSR
ncbi:MAG: hypothetical protein BWK79_00690 [Beggiatoa sp. IS2]|nr:MAG: hypothetical protein BWK79_00690 [Beggiatoa sp. IS2]